ncbi:MAG TPA: C40 family peptidase [Chitinophagaceae bacterium]|nr:C40 family peptidase [Chitinophagaceae bacterium]
MEYAVVTVPAAPVHRKASHRKEMVNQLLFGEMVAVRRIKQGRWVKIRSLHDQYEGWMTLGHLEAVTEKEAMRVSNHVTVDFLSKISLHNKSMQIPIGSSLPGWEEHTGNMGGMNYLYEGTSLKRDEQVPGAELLHQLSFPWLNSPYMWGGRTPLGVDCSGFVQINFKMMGIDLPRDAWQQVQEGQRVKKLKEARAGDLAFFDDKDEIVHVGILLNPEQIIHSSGKVRIDPIDKKGIVHSDTGKRTHRLEAIRRYW